MGGRRARRAAPGRGAASDGARRRRRGRRGARPRPRAAAADGAAAGAARSRAGAARPRRADRRRDRARDRPAPRCGRPRAPSTSSASIRRHDVVTIYRGLPYELPLGIELYERYYPSGVRFEQVPAASPRHVHRPQAAVQGRRREPRDRARAGPARVSARNRELLALVPASLLLTAGFAAIFIQESEVVSDVSLTYGAIFLGLCFAGHLFLRFTLPYADPYMFPLVAVLACFGLVVIYRIDDELAREQAQWFVVGLLPVRGDDPAAARPARARALPLHDRARRPGAAASCRACPASASRSTARTWAWRSARSPSSRPSSARSRSSSSWPRTCATRGRCWCRARGAILGVTIPPLKHFGPLLVVWGAAMVHARLHPRPRVVADVLRRLPGAALRGHEPAVVRDDRAGAVRARRVVHGLDGQPRAGPRRRSGSIRSTRSGSSRRAVPDRAVAVRAGRRRVVRHRARRVAAQRARRRRR